jgi:hypothetical protein
VREWQEHLVEWRARSIRDPVARLRYLRQAGAKAQQPARRWSGWWMIAPVAAAAVLLAPASLRPPGAAEVEARTVEAEAPPLPVPVSPLPPSVNASAPAPGASPVWLVDSRRGHQIYSNGLRVETAGTVRNEPRDWVRLNLESDRIERGGGAPAGIVYHSTESHSVPFEASQNARLRRAGESVLEYVTRHRSYHYLIDRFGRVHRVVDEQDAAWHAGAAIWGDAGQVWLNLNHSFLGVALEAATAGEKGDRNPITPAQTHAAKTLTEMLRSRFSIPAERCVTHAQVSVNASKFLLGNHTDWASGFPFAELGLPDNYAQPLASMTVFGFRYDPEFLAAGAAAWTGLALSEQQVRQRAAASSTSVPTFRAALRERYRKLTARLSRDKESTDE